MHTLSITLLLVSILLLPLFTSSARAQDLLDIYRLAARNDPQLQAAAQARRAALETRPQAVAQLLPSLEFQGNLSRNRFDDKKGPTTYSTNHTFTLELRQPLYNRTFWTELEQADSQIAQAEADFVAAQQDLLIRVAQSYFNVLAARAELRFIRADKEATLRQLEQARSQFEAGIAAITAVREAQAQFDQSAAQETVAENDVNSQREALSAITGEMHRDLADVKKKVPLLTPEPPEKAPWVEKAMVQNPQIISDRHRMAAARQEIERRRSGHFPQLDLVADYSVFERSFGGAFEQERQDTSIQVQLNLPIYEGGGVVSQTEEAVHLFKQVQHELERSRRQVTRQARDAYRGIIAGIRQVRALKQAVKSARTALDATQAGYDVGTRTIVDVLNAQRGLFEAQRDRDQALYDYIVSTLNLKQASGTLQPQDLRRVDTWLRE